MFSKYGFFITMMTLVFYHFGHASNPVAICLPLTIKFQHLTEEDLTKGINAERKDSSAYGNVIAFSYLETRNTWNMPELKDTIRKSSENRGSRNINTPLSSLRRKADNNFVTRNLFSLIIKEGQPLKKQMEVKSTNYFQPYAGKKVGKIRIQQLDVFGPTLLDTSKHAITWIEKTGNGLHAKTTEKKLRKQLLFNPGDALDPQLMAENEKIFRDLPYIQDVEIVVSHSKSTQDEVDVLVVVQERFEYGINGSLVPSPTEVEIVNKNMFGSGHQFTANLDYHPTEKPIWGSSANYEISDFGAKFIKSRFGYTNTFRKRGWNVLLDKKFIASTIDWAGGFSVERTFEDYYQTPYSYTKLSTASSYLYLDTWYGHFIKNDDISSSLGNMIVAGRYLHQNYYNGTSNYHGNSFFRDHDFILGTFGVSKRYLFKNKQIYGFGITEDIPYGRYAEVAIGFDRENDKENLRPYFHLRYSKANILSGGAYFKWQVGVGGYIGDTQMEQGALLINANYFSKYVFFNDHPYRLFVNLELMSGFNRYKEEYLIMNGKFGIRDFYSLDTKGTNRLKINIESVRFWGWGYSGFSFAHYFFSDAAFLSNDLKNIFRESFYSGLGFGIRVNNESLVFNVLELRLSWFPIAPKNGEQYIFKAFGQPKARFDDFLGGKPEEIVYE